MNWFFRKKDETRENELNVIEEGIRKIVNPMGDEKNSRLHVMGSHIDKYGTMIIEIGGGLNGWGEWDKYLKDLSKLVKKVKEEYDIWLLELQNDSLDDLFYCTFGVNFKKDKHE